MSATMTIFVSAPAMPMGRLLNAYWTDSKYEALRMLRAPAFAIPFLIIPVAVYLLFGVVIAGQGGRTPQEIHNLLFIGFCVLAVMGPTLFGVGSTLAPERDAGLTKLKRALPQPAGSYLIAKFVMALFFALLAMGLMVATGLLAGKISLTGVQLAALTAVLVFGSLPFCAIGLAIGAYFSGSAAPAVTNLIYLPMMWLGGLFIPLPEFLQKWVVVWPAFHLQQLAVAVADIDGYQFMPVLNATVVLAGLTVASGGLAMRRLARVG